MDDWVVTCNTAAEARMVVAAQKILEQLGMQLHPQKTPVVHVPHGFEFLGYKIQRGVGCGFGLTRFDSGAKSGAVVCVPTREIDHFMDEVRRAPDGGYR